MKQFFVVFFLALFFFIGPAAAGPVDTKPPQRIVSLTLGTDEILLSLIDPKRVIAVTTLSIDPGISNVVDLARTVPNKIGRASVEPVIALQPDLVLVASYTANDIVEQLKAVGLNVVRLTLFSSIAGIKQNIREVGKVVQAQEKAAALISKMEHRLHEIKERISRTTVRPRLLAYSPEGWTAGAETIFDEMVVFAGGRNLGAEAGITGHRKISLETVVLLNPEMMILSRWQPESSEFSQIIQAQPALKEVAAIKEKRVFFLQEKHLTTVSHFIVEGIENLARLLHPQVFSSMSSN